MLLDLLKPIDNRDDRTQIWHLLAKLDFHQRMEFLRWAVDRVNEGVPIHGKIAITANTGTIDETYNDLVMLIAIRDLNLNVVLRELERRGREKKLAVGI